jgi:hypothetical protein
MKHKIVLAAIFIALGFACRFFNYPPNFTPLSAIALFSGFYFYQRWSWLIPMIILATSDTLLGFYNWQIMVSVYVSYLSIWLLGYLLKKYYRSWSLGLNAIASSLIFFIITNLAFWYFSGFYPFTLNGLMSCFVLALPFFKNTLLGDLFFISVIFGSYSLIPFLQKIKTVRNANKPGILS